jgi:flagellar hook-basal body complex protein FliE
MMDISAVSAAGIGTGSLLTSQAADDAKFTDILGDALKAAEETDAADKAGNIAMLSGEDTALHTTMIEAQKAELALQFTIQIRNKIIDAYNEMMRMQI